MTTVRSRPTSSPTACSRCGQPIRSLPQLDPWIQEMLLGGSRLYCSPACMEAGEKPGPGARGFR